ncbi:hypothetical protein [Nocardia sp. BMG111209]|uniref:hypothetical protein n=1 Tax=Nocardia sp. BMG111209 TaxID=1160137 RepID=UPI000364C421|nr:hypothetical protein [Nocardia sp. BMG111209]
MACWEPGTAERLQQAALELFASRGDESRLPIPSATDQRDAIPCISPACRAVRNIANTD